MKAIANKEKIRKLEDRVNQKVSLNMGVEEFLGKASREGYRYNSLYIRIWHSITGSYRYMQGEIKTLKDLKDVIENKSGIGCFPGLGYKSFAFFNKMLKRYELEPFKIGGRHYLQPVERRKMGKYKLKPAHDISYYFNDTIRRKWK